MESFRSEYETGSVDKGIVELEKKIHEYKHGKIGPNRFRSLHLARGIYGQRQPNVQMVRIKLPLGKFSSQQLRRIARVGDTYSDGRLHITTRQDIQVYHVSLDDTPRLWDDLEQDELTIREACGNTVRNVTASPFAGASAVELFDVTPFAQAVFRFFLANPIGSELGRKIKIAFSSSAQDEAHIYFHDIGFIPRKQEDTIGFKVVIGGGLGAQPHYAQTLYEFIPSDKLIPTIESILRFFDHYGERSKREKARIKFLVKSLGIDKVREEIESHALALSHQSVPIQSQSPTDFHPKVYPPLEIQSPDYLKWKQANVFAQKQADYYAIGIQVPLGNFYTHQAYKLADIIDTYTQDQPRFSISQNILLRGVHHTAIPHIYRALQELDWVKIGFETTVDITSCPGTDTCNLAIANSTNLATQLSQQIQDQYSHLIFERQLDIKLSGCMNSCGQHMVSQIGFHGMSIKSNGKVAPAMQVLLGGKREGDGNGTFADKIIKIPSKRTIEALDLILNDYTSSSQQNFNAYYQSKGKPFFEKLLQPLVDRPLEADEFLDWGKSNDYEGIKPKKKPTHDIDLVASTFFDSEHKLDQAKNSFEQQNFSDSIYHSYTSMVNIAKALLFLKDINTNTQIAVINTFTEEFDFMDRPFKEIITQMKKEEPTKAFAQKYLNDAQQFLEQSKIIKKQI